MSETLGDVQKVFANLLPRLFDRIRQSGYSFTLGEAYRSDEQAEINALGSVGRKALADEVGNDYPRLAAALRNNAGGGIAHSVHQLRLAIDLNLFDPRGAFVTTTEGYRQFGEFWETLHPLARWGGRFADGDHFSFEWQGVK